MHLDTPDLTDAPETLDLSSTDLHEVDDVNSMEELADGSAGLPSSKPGHGLSTVPHLPSPSDFNAYARAVQQWPLLGDDEERRLANAWFHHQDRDAARRLVLSHLRLVVKIVRAHAGYNVNPGDLVQEGNIGLMKAVKRFNPDRGARLSTYATLWIEAEIRDYLINNWRMVKIGGTAALKKLFFGYRRTLATLLREGDHDAKIPLSTLEIAHRLGVDETDVRTAEAYFRGHDMGWDPDQDNEAAPSPGVLENEARESTGWDMVSHEEDPADTIEHKLDDEKASTALHRAMLSLNDRERAILTARRLTEPPVGLSELAETWSISMERVRQIDNQALVKLKKATLLALSHPEPATLLALPLAAAQS